MRGQECDVVGDRTFYPFSSDGQVAETSPVKLRALPGDRGTVRGGRYTNLRKC